MKLRNCMLLAMAVLGSAQVFAGTNKFTSSQYETPDGRSAKVLSNTNQNDVRWVVACNNKTIGEEGLQGRMLLVAQDHDVIIATKALGNNRIRVTTQNGWSEVFRAHAIPRC